MKVLVFIPTYNERENVEPLIRALYGLGVPGLDVLIVDDASPDGTPDAVRALQKEFPGLRLMVRQGPRGRGLAGRDGFLAGLESGADYTIEMDGDFSHDPRFIPDLLKAMERCDLAIGSRRAPGGRDERGAKRLLLTRFANAYARLLLGMRVLDMNSGFRCFDRKALEAVQPETLRSTGPSIVHEALHRVNRARLRIEEVPIVFRDRKKGVSKLDLPRLARGFLWILRLRIQDA